MNDPKPLSARNAEISTATVEIRTVTVSKKQMTQAVFRQLIEEPLVNRDGTLNGNPWGSVNYHPGDCAEPCRQSCSDGHGQHLHIVWQKGGELRRDTVWEQDWCTYLNNYGRLYAGSLIAPVLQAAFCLYLHKGLPDWIVTETFTGTNLTRLSFTCAGVVCEINTVINEHDVPKAPWQALGTPRWARRFMPGEHEVCRTQADLSAAGAAMEANDLVRDKTSGV